MSDGSTPSQSSLTHSYHCLCTTLILATKHSLESLPKRADPALDQAYILPLQLKSADEKPHSLLHNLVPDRKRMVVRREDGFEKRCFLRCSRCKLVMGYRLDDDQFQSSDGVRTEDVVYLLPGGLLSTKDMEAGKAVEEPQWARQNS